MFLHCFIGAFTSTTVWFKAPENLGLSLWHEIFETKWATKVEVKKHLKFLSWTLKKSETEKSLNIMLLLNEDCKLNWKFCFV